MLFRWQSLVSWLADSGLRFISEYDGKHFPLHWGGHSRSHLSDYWTNNLCKPAPRWLSEAYFALWALAAVSACLWNWLGSLGDFLLKVHANSPIHHWTWFNHGPSFRVLWIEEAANFYYKSEEKWLMNVPSNNRYISLHIFCVLSESDATFNVGPLSIGPGLLERIMIFLVLIILVFLILPNESIHCY